MNRLTTKHPIEKADVQRGHGDRILSNDPVLLFASRCRRGRSQGFKFPAGKRQVLVAWTLF